MFYASFWQWLLEINECSLGDMVRSVGLCNVDCLKQAASEAWGGKSKKYLSCKLILWFLVWLIGWDVFGWWEWLLPWLYIQRHACMQPSYVEFSFLFLLSFSGLIWIKQAISIANYKSQFNMVIVVLIVDDFILKSITAYFFIVKIYGKGSWNVLGSYWFALTLF